MKTKKFNEFVNEESETNERLKVFMKDILAKMIPAAFSYKSDAKMRKELEEAVAKAIEPILIKYNYIVESKIIEEEETRKGQSQKDFYKNK